MELRGYCTAVKDVEKIIEGLVSQGKAELIKDSSKPFSLPVGKNIPADKNLIKSPNNVRVYQIYVSGGKIRPIAAITRVNIRFWYDERVNKASIKISQEGMGLLIQYAPQILAKDMIEAGTVGKPDNISM